MRCVVCGSDALEVHLRVAGEAGPQGLIPTTERFGTALDDIVRCRACGHMQLSEFPAPEQLGESYAVAESRDYIEEEAGQRQTAARLLDQIEAHIGPGRLLDLGCWVGFLLDEARGRGWETVGVEPSEFASRYGRVELGLDIHRAALLEADLPAHGFDAVVLADVIEHLPNPGAALDRIRELVAPGGVVAMALPDAGSRLARLTGRRWWSVIPTHVQYFTRGSIGILLSRHGFRVLSISTAPKTFSVGYYLGRVRGYSERAGDALLAVAGRAGVADRQWTPDLRDRMLVIAATHA